MHCKRCMEGSHHLCQNGKGTMVGHHGGFADQVRCHWSSAILLPVGIDIQKAGPLLFGGITDFLVRVKPTDKVGVIGIGGLGHIALKFLIKWGCEVISFGERKSKIPYCIEGLTIQKKMSSFLIII